MSQKKLDKAIAQLEDEIKVRQMAIETLRKLQQKPTAGFAKKNTRPVPKVEALA
jgi:hypothetical protein